LAFLPDRQSRQEDENQPILAERKTELRVPGDLEEEMAVPALEEKLIRRSDGSAGRIG
jgi:hypothetical protein